MASPPPNQFTSNIDEPFQQLGEQIFGTSYSQNPNYFPTNTNFPQNVPTPQFFQAPPPDLNFFPHTVSSGSGAGSTYASTPTAPVPHVSVGQTEIEEEVEATPSTSQPGLKKRKGPRPRYNAAWWRFYEQTLDPDTGKVISARCKVKDCKGEFIYDEDNGLSSFLRHARAHEKDGKEPQEKPDSRSVQSVINPDGTRTHQRYDEKKMLSEFARYIAHKEQPISMGGCLSFARLMIRGCGQPFYKRIHYRKMTKELKQQFTDRKNELIAIFATTPFKVSLTSDIWTAGKHGLSYICITAHYIDDSWKLQKRVLSFRVIEWPHAGEVVFQAIMGVAREYNLKNDLEDKIISISFDNASNNNKAIEYFFRSLSPIMDGALFHQKCACHVLNLTVKAGLKTSGVSDLIQKF
jgi:hypothetical protein